MSQEQAKQFIDQATQSLQSGQFQQALELLDQAIALAPSDSEAQVLRGVALSQLGQPNEATEAFRMAIMNSPYNAKAYYNMAVHQYSLGNKVEALEMAREAVKIDGRHAAARQLMTSIEGELHTPVAPGGTRPFNPNDPLSTPAAPAPPPADDKAMPPGVGGPMMGAAEADAQILQPEAPRVETPSMQPPPAQGPYSPPPQQAYGAPQQPYSAPTPPQTYYRGGYEQTSAHSIAFIEKMGSAWAAFGWVISAISLGTFIIFMVIFVNAFSAGVSQNDAAIQQVIENSQGIGAIARIGMFTSLLLGIGYMVLDLVDRRGNFLWLIPQALCGCCLTWLIMPIYMLAGRK